jgi:hypothetical protein
MTAAKRIAVGAPTAMAAVTSQATFALGQLDSSSDKWAAVFQVPEDATITHLGFRYGARTGTPPTYRISLQSLDATTGFPDTTVLGGASPASGTFTPPADATWNGTWQWVALDNSYAAVRGQVLAMVIDHSSGTIDASNRSSYTFEVSNANWYGAGVWTFPYNVWDQGAGYAKRTGHPIFGVRTASARYGFPLESFYDTLSAATNGHRQAMKFTLPAGWGSTFKVVGVRGHFRLAHSVTSAAKIALWSASSELQAISIDSDNVSSATSQIGMAEFYFDEASLTELSFGTTYYIGVEVTNTIACELRGIQLDSADDLSAYPGGDQFYFSSYNGSAWSDDQTVRPLCELILDDITEPAGGSGSTPATLVGGIFQ